MEASINIIIGHSPIDMRPTPTRAWNILDIPNFNLQHVIT
jgi:hypothetical protein